METLYLKVNCDLTIISELTDEIRAAHYFIYFIDDNSHTIYVALSTIEQIKAFELICLKYNAAFEEMTSGEFASINPSLTRENNYRFAGMPEITNWDPIQLMLHGE